MKTRIASFARGLVSASSAARHRRFLAGAAAMFALGAGTISAQTPGTVDTTFPDLNISGSTSPGLPPAIVHAIAMQPDGKMIIGGHFDSVGGAPHVTLARINPNDSVDAGFNAATNGEILCVTVQPDGKLLVGGLFNTVSGGAARDAIARFNADGSLDTGFNAGSIVHSPGGNPWVFGITLQEDSKILINGLFTSLGGVGRVSVARLNPDGSLDPSFNPGSGPTVGAIPSSAQVLALRPDGKILVGGAFTSFAGVQGNGPVLLDANGNLNSSFSASALNTFSMLIQPDGKILISNYDSQVNGVPTLGNARLNPDGTLDQSFISSHLPTALSLQTDGRMMTTNHFLNADGSKETSRNLFFTSQSAAIGGAAHQADGKILIGGNFPELNGVVRHGLTRFHNDPATQILSLVDSSRARWMRSGSAPEVYRVSFELSTNGGASWSALGFGTRIPGGWERGGLSLPTSGMVRARGVTKSSYYTASYGLVEQVLTYSALPPTVTSPTSTAEAGFATLGGTVTSDGGAAITERGVVYSLASVNGDPLIGQAGVTKASTSGTTGAFAVDVAGLAAGATYSFKAYATNSSGTAYTSPVSSFDTALAGVTDASYDPNVGGGQVVATAVQPDGKAVIGGTFATVGGAGHANLARVNPDGSVDATFNPTFNSSTAAVGIQGDGKILVAGGFSLVNGTVRNGIARLHADGSLDSSFNPGTTGVSGLAVQADGKVVIVGSFTSVLGTGRNRIARLNVDGTLDMTFDPGTGANDEILGVALQSNGTITIGGLFTSFNGFSHSRIARLNANGSLDVRFTVSEGANAVVNCVSVQSNGRILLGGDFTMIGNTPLTRIARLHDNGTVDSTFDPGAGANSAVRSMVVQANGKVLAAGAFTSMNGATRNGVARLNPDGSVDPTLDPNAGAIVSSVALQDDGQILVGGNFTIFNGSPRNGMARLSNGTPEQTLSVISPTRAQWQRSGTGPEISSAIMEFSTDGGASWTFADKGIRNNGIWYFLSLGLPPGGIVRALGHTAGGQYDGSSGLVQQQSAAFTFAIPTLTAPASGSVTSNGASLSGFIASDGGSATTEHGVVYAPTAVNSNPLISGAGVTRISSASGGFVGLFQLSASGLSPATGYTFRAYATNSTGTGYTTAAAFVTPAAAPSIGLPTSANVTFNSATLGGDVANDGGSVITERGVVYSATTTNNNPLIGGAGVTKLTSAGTTGAFTVNATGLVVSTGYSFKAYAINALGTTYTAPVSTFTTQPAPSGVGLPEPGYDPNVAGTTVGAIAVQPNGKTILGGTFTTVGGVAHQNIARLNANGSLDGTFNTTLNSPCYSIAVQADGKILVGGGFSLVNGLVSPGLARLNPDGTLESSATFNIGGGPNQLVSAVTVQVDGKILIGGAFTAFNGTPRNYIARLNPDGSLDAGFNPGSGANGEVLGLAVQDDGKILLAGDFTSVNGTARNRIARLNTDGSVDATFNPGTGTNGLTYCAALQADGKILLGGLFSTFNDAATGSLTRLNSDGTVDGNFISGDGANGFVQTITVQADGRLLCAGGFTSINGTARSGLARLNANGTLDATFNPGTAGGVNGIAALALQADGQLLVGGSFTSFNGQPRNRFARVGNEPATQGLTAPSQSVVQWLRGGGSPEAFYASLDLSLDGGANWTPLTAATRVAGGWQFNGLNLPATGLLRARARTAGGIYTGSSGLVEQQQAFTLALPTVTTPTLTGLTGTGAVLGGNVSGDGGAAIIERGVIYSATALNSNPLPRGTDVSKLTTTGTTGVFTVPIGGLEPGTGYSWKAYATNVFGTTYTAPVSNFTTQGPPLLTAPLALNITAAETILFGTIAGNGGAEITERGVVYSPTADNDDPFIGGEGVTQLAVPAGTGGFINSIIASLSGLTPGTEYSARAYATNLHGTTHTEPVVTFTTLTLVEAWRKQYYNTTANSGNAADDADPDGDGDSNHFEFVAGLVPTDSSSRFLTRIESVPGFPNAKSIIFSPVVAGRTYVVKTTTDLSSPDWLPPGSFSISEDGSERIVTDLNAIESARFYRVEITKP